MSHFRLVASATASNPNVHDLYLDESGQPEIIGTDIADTEDYARAVAQDIKCRLLLVKGEWYQDQRIGTPWREKIWRKGTTAQTLYNMVRDVVLQTPGVRSVETMEIDLDTASRSATITDMQVITESGIVVTTSDLDEPFIIEAPENTL